MDSERLTPDMWSGTCEALYCDMKRRICGFETIVLEIGNMVIVNPHAQICLMNSTYSGFCDLKFHALNVAEMGSVHICLLYAARSSLVLVDRNLCYVKLVDTVMTKFNLDPTKVAVTMSYLLNVDLPPVRINSDSNVLSYITLKGMECDPSNIP
ncbi:Hypothetical predicted protein [Olea europaea subsp. europaea]|uniref:Uncharacterized protein n=1 Tax=Olea europaea subsp. europaea TaxID=158383 RepID=A0A8S0V772_OLEEU|nr:Hypothetical predicted protein [Olea europaea subsp. europaea]